MKKAAETPGAIAGNELVVAEKQVDAAAAVINSRNPDQSLAPGMYATVKWPVQRTQPALYVPKTSVVTTTERTFVIREKNGKAQPYKIRQNRKRRLKAWGDRPVVRRPVGPTLTKR